MSACAYTVRDPSRLDGVRWRIKLPATVVYYVQTASQIFFTGGRVVATPVLSLQPS